ncbi:amino acid ABC transporter substrate-binding protein [Oxynema sp. CENA135]|uniref:amino acid ABC transporter substrate-binding protein n=1 Tax=Oxynema sp. CENA135 TaxID=984206 RepID=UPI00190B3495|nr:amino acid ABC transporter substrate-binding protein [Oxynema sp. CENA135]MBK4730519.1 amino acid ABC transporter substrate-binding protein [Oxynema sp. CENA135]
MAKWGLLPLVSLCLALVVGGCGPSVPPSSTSSGSASNTSPTLERIKTKGRIVCGVSGELPGFSFVNTQGEYAGLDVEICRAIAAAVFDDPTAVEFRNLNAKERFTAVTSGEVDLLSRNTTFTLSRDTGAVAMEFGPVVFYDGQGIMVRKDSGIESLKDLENKAICTQTGTTNEQNLADVMGEQGLAYQPVVFEDVNVAYATYAEGRCQAVTSDRSQLLSRRSRFPNPEDHQILENLISKEPLAPAVSDGDPRWTQVLRWVVYATIYAEELGITSKNIEEQANNPNPEVKRFLGTEGNLGQELGLSPDFAARVIKHVGNYGEMYDRNLGPQTPLSLDRGLNKLWTDGGLMYAPPFR